MYDLIFNFIKNAIFGTSSLAENIVNDACNILSIIIIILFVVLLIRLVMWAFFMIRNAFRGRRHY